MRQNTDRRRPSKTLERLVLDILRSSERPLAAREIASAAERYDAALLVAQVYRTLRGLMAAGAVQRVESWNAFMPRTRRAPLLLLCSKCCKVTEIEDDGIAKALALRAHEQDFSSGETVLEMKGTCANCAT